MQICFFLLSSLHHHASQHCASFFQAYSGHTGSCSQLRVIFSFYASTIVAALDAVDRVSDPIISKLLPYIQKVISCYVQFLCRNQPLGGSSMSVIFSVSVKYLIRPVISTGPEFTAVRLQSRHLHDCVPVGGEGGNGDEACRQACRAN